MRHTKPSPTRSYAKPITASGIVLLTQNTPVANSKAKTPVQSRTMQAHVAVKQVVPPGQSKVDRVTAEGKVVAERRREAESRVGAMILDGR